MAGYEIKEIQEGDAGFCPRGGALDLWKCKDHEVMISGPAETGKTYACLQKLDALMWKYPGSQAGVVRKTYSSLVGSVLKTYKNVLGKDTPVTFYGGEKPEWADYPHGSRVFFGGMDNPNKMLSSERDFIYVNQSEELELGDWETLTTRCTGRAANAPYAQIFGDCNPGPPTHWILSRSSLRLFESRHEHNPTLFDDDGRITSRGVKTLAILDNLTGVRKQRLRYGKWVQAEGAVYEGWDRAIHLIDRFVIPANWKRIRSTDFGYINPHVCQWWTVDGDDRMYLYREIYRTKRLVSDHTKDVIRLSQGERVSGDVADHDAEDRATMEAGGITTIAAYKAVKPGIENVQDRLKVQGDGRPRLFVFRDSLVERDEELAEAKRPCCTAEEFEVYTYAKGQDGRPLKDEPVKMNDHGMDAMRYAAAYVDRLGADPIPSPPRAGGTRPTLAPTPGMPQRRPMMPGYGPGYPGRR